MYVGYKYDPRPCKQMTNSSITLSAHRHPFLFSLFRRVLAFELGCISLVLRRKGKACYGGLRSRVSRPEFLSKIPNAYMCDKPSSRNQPRHTMTILIIEYN